MCRQGGGTDVRPVPYGEADDSVFGTVSRDGDESVGDENWYRRDTLLADQQRGEAVSWTSSCV